MSEFLYNISILENAQHNDWKLEMKLARVCKIVGVERRTALNWIERDEFNILFSEGARVKGDVRELNERDVTILNTIRAFREQRMEWQEISTKISDGVLVSDFPLASAEVDTGRTPLQQFTRQLSLAEQVSELQLELSETQRALDKERLDRAEEKEKLMREYGAEIAALNRQIGKLEGKLESLQDE